MFDHVQWRQRNVQSCCFAYSNLLLFWRSRWILSLLGSFSKDVGDGNESVKKAIGLLIKTTLHVHNAFLLFLCRHCTTTTWECLISRFMEDVNKRQRIFLSLISTKNWSTVPKKSTPRKFIYVGHFQLIGINATMFKKKREFLLKVMFLLPSPSSMLKLPINSCTAAAY